jgi:hypothetical protein
MIHNIRAAMILGTAVATTAMTFAQAAPSPAPPSAQSMQEAAAQADQTPASVVPLDQQPSKEQLAKLFEVMRLREQMQSMMKMMPAMVQQQVREQLKQITANMPNAAQMTPKQQAALDQFQNKIMTKAMNIYPYEDMISDITVVYQRHVSSTDVDAFIAFYSSPAGQHLLDQQPAIMKEYMPLVMKRMSERSKELTDEIMKDAAEFSKEYGTPAKAAPAAK